MNTIKPFSVVCVEQALELNEDQIDLAITCIVNAMACRDINPDNRKDLVRVLGDMQKRQRAIWRGH